MTIDGLVTFLALLVAVFTVMSRAQRLNLRLKVRPVHIVVICLALIAIISLELYESLFKLGLVPCSEGWYLKPNEIAFLGVLASVIIVGGWMNVAHLPQSKLHRLRDLIEELMKTDQYTEALSLMETHLDRLAKIYRAGFLMPTIRRWLESFNPSSEVPIERLLQRLNLSNVDISNAPQPSLSQKVCRAVSDAVGRIAARIGRLFPSGEVEKQWVTDIFLVTLLHPEYIRAVAKIRPYFGLRILSLDIRERYDFSEEYFRQLLVDRTSILYWEIKNNQNLSVRHRYDLPDANRLLRHIFHDARVAEALGVWQPIGEQMITELDYLHRNADEDRYNGPLEDYRERGLWKCPLFVGIRFFDIMVSEAIDQNIQWHMWLYYYTHITERICRNYHLDPQKIDPDDEFPTPYSSLLYEIVSTLRDWIQKVRELPVGQDNTVLKAASLEHENGNPIKSSILALGECLRTIFITENVPPRLKRYLGSIVLNLYFEFERQDNLSRYAEVLRTILVVGGLFERRDEGSEYLGNIIHALVRNDNVPHRHEDVSQLIRMLVHRFIEKFGQETLSGYVQVEPLEDGSIRLSSERRGYIVELSGGE